VGGKGYLVDESRTIAQSLAGVRDAESAFAFIEWFAREWLTPIGDGDGCTAKEAAAVEERLGLPLPASLVAFYRLIGWRRDLTSHQDALITLNSLMVKDGALVYRIEAEGVAAWGVRVSDLKLADPPVVFGCGDGSPWRPFLGSFSLAAVEIVLSEAVGPGTEGRHDNRQLDDADIIRLEEQYESLPFPDYAAWWQGSLMSRRLSAGSADPASCSGRRAGPGFGYSRGTRRVLPGCGMRCQESGSWPLSEAALQLSIGTCDLATSVSMTLIEPLAILERYRVQVRPGRDPRASDRLVCKSSWIEIWYLPRRAQPWRGLTRCAWHNLLE
jgi:hypothetical protein